MACVCVCGVCVRACVFLSDKRLTQSESQVGNPLVSLVQHHHAPVSRGDVWYMRCLTQLGYGAFNSLHTLTCEHTRKHTETLHTWFALTSGMSYSCEDQCECLVSVSNQRRMYWGQRGRCMRVSTVFIFSFFWLTPFFLFPELPSCYEVWKVRWCLGRGNYIYSSKQISSVMLLLIIKRDFYHWICMKGMIVLTFPHITVYLISINVLFWCDPLC